MFRSQQWSGISFCKLFSFSRSSSQSALASSPFSSQGLKNKQGGTCSLPDLRGGELLLTVFSFFLPLFYFSFAAGAAHFLVDEPYPAAAVLILCMLCRGLVPRSRPLLPCHTPLPALLALGKLLPPCCYHKADAQMYLKHAFPPGLISRVKFFSQPCWDVATEQAKGSHCASHLPCLRKWGAHEFSCPKGMGEVFSPLPAG